MDGAKSINDSGSEYSLDDLKASLDTIQDALRSNTQSKITEIPELISTLKQMVQDIHSIPTPVLQRVQFVSKQVWIIIPIPNFEDTPQIDPNTKYGGPIYESITTIDETKFPIEMSLNWIEVSIQYCNGKGKKRKYIGAIDGNWVELSPAMCRIILGIGRNHPEKFRLATTDIRYMRSLKSLFPEGRLLWERGKWCWISEKVNIAQVENPLKVRDWARSPEEPKKKIGAKVKSARPRNIDYSAAPKNLPRAKRKVEAPKAISNYKTTVSWNTLSVEWDWKQTYTILYQGQSYSVEFKSSEHELLQRILRKETFWIVWNTKTLLDYINLRLERETPFVLAKTDALYDFILKENIQKKKSLPTGEEKQKISAAYTGWRAPSFSPKDQNMAAKVIRGEE